MTALVHGELLEEAGEAQIQMEDADGGHHREVAKVVERQNQRVDVPL